MCGTVKTFKKLCGTLSIAVLTSFVVVDARAAAQCGVNLFNPQLLDDAGFTRTNGANGEYAASGTWEYLDNYVSNYSFNFLPDKAYTVSYSIECPEELVGNTYLTFKLSVRLRRDSKGKNSPNWAIWQRQVP